MRYFGLMVLLLCVLKINGANVWIKDLISEKGLDMGYGVALKLNESKKGENVRAMERLSLDLNFGDVASVSLGNPRSDGIELDFYVNKDLNIKEEGRGKKNDNGGKQMLQLMIGYKAALVASIMFGIMKVLTIKAIFLAKLALIISLFILMFKLKSHSPMEIIDMEQHPSHVSYGDYSPHSGYEQHGHVGGAYYGHQGFGRVAQPSNIYPDIVYAPSAPTEGDASLAYASINPSGSAQAISNSRKDQDSEGRKNTLHYRKHKGKGGLLTIKKYPSSAEI